MNRTYKEILRHAGIFGAGAILGRLASIVLLPVYTHYLAPTDYGVMAILDLAINLLSIVAGAGIASAATRAHFNGTDDTHHDRVWWTAVLTAMVAAGLIMVPAFVLRARLSVFLFGSILHDGGYYLAIALPTLWIGSVTYVVDSYFRSLKASSFVVRLGLFRLLLNILLNMTFLVGWKMGVSGILWGNLLSAGIVSLIQGAWFMRARRRILFDWPLARTYWHFGWPLVVFGLFSTVMHEADRYVLRLFVSLEAVGLYSVAYQIGQGVNTLVVSPFAGIWAVIIYEIAKEPDAKVTFSHVFKNYFFFLSLVLLLASLFARPILYLMAPAEYAPAADIVPVVCLAYLFFSIHEHFKVPAMLAGRTGALLAPVILAAGANVALNFALVPALGAIGAAWASVLTFIVFAFGGLAQYRRIDRYDYPFAPCGLALAGMTATYVGHRVLFGAASLPVQAAASAAIWLVWVGILFGGIIRSLAPGTLSWRHLSSAFSDSRSSAR